QVPPDEARASEPGPRADQYALAALAYECLTGTPVRDAPPLSRLLESRSDIPLHVSQSLRRALSSRPAERFPTVLDFVTALGGPTRTGAQRRRHRGDRRAPAPGGDVPPDSRDTAAATAARDSTPAAGVYAGQAGTPGAARGTGATATPGRAAGRAARGAGAAVGQLGSLGECIRRRSAGGQHAANRSAGVIRIAPPAGRARRVPSL